MSIKTTIELVDRASSGFERMEQSGRSAIDGIGASVDSTNSSFSDYYSSATQAASATDHWTSAVGNYSKSALEATYSTEELVEQGFKTADALSEEREMFGFAQKASDELSSSLEATKSIEDDLVSSLTAGVEASEQYADSDKVSAERKEELATAVQTASEAMIELRNAQEEALTAQENYNQVIESGTTDLETIEAAAGRMADADERLVNANATAAESTDQVSKATEGVSEEFENAEKTGVDAIGAIAETVVASAIADKVRDIAVAAYEMIEAFSEAKETVVFATGATGEQLDSLSDSMLNAYSVARSADLSSTAEAVGEINTRLHLQGEELEDTTSMYLDYANVTNQNVGTAVSSTSKLMNQWNVDLSENRDLLDKLTYAGQVSGIGVGGLSDALVTNKSILDQLDFTLDESIGLLANMELQGLSTSTVMTGFRTAIKNISESGGDAAEDLRYYINEIATMRNETEATNLAVELFGSRAGVGLANAIRSGALEINNLTAILEGSEGALESTADASQTLDKKWTQATNNINAAFTKSLAPVTEGISSGFADIVNGIGDYLNEHPVLVKALTVVGVGLGAAALGVVGVGVASLTAIPQVAAFGATLQASLGPIGWVSAAVSGLAAVVMLVASNMEESEPDYKKYTASTLELKDKIDDTTAAHERAVKQYGEASYQAKELEAELGNLQSEYDNTSETMEEHKERLEETIGKYDELLQGHKDSIAEAETEAGGINNLSDRLVELTSSSDKAVGSQNEILAIVDALNAAIPDLGLSYDSLTNSLNMTSEQIQATARAFANKDLLSDFQKDIQDAVKEQAKLSADIQKQSGEVKAAQSVYDKAVSNPKYQEYLQRQHELTDGMTAQQLAGRGVSESLYKLHQEYSTYIDQVQTAGDNLETEKGALNSLKSDYDGYQKTIDDTSNKIDGLNKVYLESGDAVVDAVGNSIDGSIQSMEKLATAYEEAYKTALDSFTGQFGLFDEAEANSEATVGAAQKALDTQLTYWDTYSKNLSTIKKLTKDDLNMTQTQYDSFMSNLQDGSKNAAGLAQSMADNIKNGNKQAVVNMADTYTQVQKKQESAADKVAKWKTDFNQKLTAIQNEMQTTVDKMEASSEAKANAEATINAYISGLRSGITGAHNAALAVKNAAKSALGDNYKNDSVKGYAVGTLNAEPGLALVGENGPELVNFDGGEVVYTTQQTQSIINNMGGETVYDTPVPSKDEPSEETPINYGNSEKKIVVEIGSNGRIVVQGGSVDREAVAAVIRDEVEPILIDIIEREVEEEGVETREY